MNYHIPIQQQLDQINNKDKGRDRKKILILGAGIAGLAAGYELAQRGHQVQILEASSRVGGRIWTHRFKDGYGELGAMRIPASHDYTRHYISQLNLRLRSFINTNLEAYRDFEGIICRAKDAIGKIGNLFDLSPQNRDEIRKDNDHDAIYINIMQHILSNLEDVDKTLLFGTDALSARLNHLDVPLIQILRQYAQTYDAVRFMGKLTVLDDYWHRSTLMFLREELDGAFSRLEEIEGGTDLLPTALADASLPDGTTLRKHITLSREVCSIEHENEGVTIAFQAKGKTETITFPYVLCTIPFSVLRRIKLEGIPDSKRIGDAIQGLGYHSATKVLVNCKQRFWELEDGIFGGASLSDSIARMTFYPSDNAKDKDRAVSEGPGVLLGSYSWGPTAQRLAALSREERGELIVKTLSRFHPNIQKHVVPDESYASMAWDQYPFASGAFSSPNPHDLQMFFPGASQPAGRLFFAGEHLSPYPTWIQGGLWSALQAVMQIVVA